MSNLTKRTMNELKFRNSFFQKENMNEEYIKVGLKPEDVFNPSQIDNYINPQKTKEELINEKIKSGKKLNSAEKIQYEHISKKLNEKKALDLIKIEEFKKNGSGDPPETEEGKIILLLHYLNTYIETKKNVPICNIYLKFQKEGYTLSPELISKYKLILEKMENVVNESDLIELQFTKFYDTMPPLNINGFKKFDPWQCKVIENINKGISTILSAPTSSGKTVLSAYTTLKGRSLFVVPTEALAWQISAYIGSFLNKDIPILTDTFNSIPKDNCPCLNNKNANLELTCAICTLPTRDKIIKNLNNAITIVGTPNAILNYLPLINNNFDWIIMDEIHMIGKPEGQAMELIAKVFNNVKFLALSATIGNIDEINAWFKKLNPKRDVENIICDKRFFNLQKYYYNSKDDVLNVLHPLALVNINDFEDGSILKKNLQATPTDTWLLYSKLKKEFTDLNKLNHQTYFGKREIINLDRVNTYFMELIKFMASVVTTEKDKISTIIDNFKNTDLPDETTDLVKLAFKLKELNKTPAIVFQVNTLACVKMFMEFGKNVENMEKTEFPTFYNDKIDDHNKHAKLLTSIERAKKKIIKENKLWDVAKKEASDSEESENDENDENGLKKLINKLNAINLQSIFEPHYKYNFNPTQVFKEEKIMEINNSLKSWFPQEKGGQPHKIIRLLWRGVGIYAKGLPDPYLRLIQKLTHDRNISILFSDMSLVFGVSMPIRTTIIYNNPYVADNLDNMLYHQMAGRAGRRGLDKQGNVIFAGYKWDRIKDLSICSIPNISGMESTEYTIPHANKMSQQKNKLNWDNVLTNSLNEKYNLKNEEIVKLNDNYNNKWSFALNKDINHLWMMWTLRNSGLYEPLIIAYLLPIINEKFNSVDDYTNTNTQNILFYLLSNFLDYKIEENDEENKKITDDLKKLDIQVPEKIDNRIWLSFKMNKIMNISNTDCENNEMRNRLLYLSQKLIAIQMYFHHNNSIILTKLLGKLIRRICNIYHDSSLLIKPIINEKEYQSEIMNELINYPSFSYYYYDELVVNNKNSGIINIDDKENEEHYDD